MHDNDIWLEATVRVRRELSVFVADVVGVLHFVAASTGVGVSESTAVSVQSAVLTAHLWIAFSPAHGTARSAHVTVRFVLLI